MAAQRCHDALAVGPGLCDGGHQQPHRVVGIDGVGVGHLVEAPCVAPPELEIWPVGARVVEDADGRESLGGNASQRDDLR